MLTYFDILKMNQYNRRLATFSVCSRELKLSPLQLARNGFSYDRKNFQVICDDCLISFDNLDISGGMPHHPDCPNYEENYTGRQSIPAKPFVSISTMDIQPVCASPTVLEQNPWKSQGLSSSDEFENTVNESCRQSSGKI